MSPFLMRFLLSLAFVAAAGAQAPTPLRYLAPDVRINGPDLSKKLLWPVGLIAIGQDGRFILWPTNSNAGINAFDADGKLMAFHVQTGWAAENEIRWPQRIGRFGAHYWVADPYNRQVAFVSPDAKVVDGITEPTWVHPKWAERRKFPIFGGMDVVAVYPDSTLLVRPGRPRTLLDTPGYDRRITHLLRINREGQIQGEIASFDEQASGVTVRGTTPGSDHVTPVPFAMPRKWSAADDGSRVAVVLPGVTDADSGTYRVISIGAHGDTVFSRRYPMATVRVTPAQVDSALTKVAGFGARSADQVRADVRKKIPGYRSFVTDVIAGFDQTTWIVTRSTVDSSTAREALILDPKGEPVARVAIPVGLNLKRADRDHLWAIDRLKPGVVRLKVQATPPPPVTTAPPPRTAKGAAAKE